MGKPCVFISHIREEGKLAQILQSHIHRDFLDLISVFVSSDGASIQVGSRWLNEIDGALKAAKVELIVCSSESVKRPWINFEAGAGWVKGIPVVPVCHSGLRASDLPIPLSMLQAIEASKVQHLEWLYSLLAQQLDSRKPSGDLQGLVTEVAQFEEEYAKSRATVAAAGPEPGATARTIESCALDSGDARLRLTLCNSCMADLQSRPAVVIAGLPLDELEERFASLASRLAPGNGKNIIFGDPEPWFFRGTPLQEAACGFNIPAVGLNVGSATDRGFDKYEVVLYRHLLCVFVHTRMPGGWGFEGATVDRINVPDLLAAVEPIAALLHHPREQIIWEQPDISQTKILVHYVATGARSTLQQRRLKTGDANRNSGRAPGN